MKRLTRKLNSRRGFTLTELLATVMILLMVTAIVAGGIPVASNAYYKVVDAGNAQVLLSTTMIRLHDELGQATEVVPAADGKSVTFRGGNTGSTTCILSDADGVKIQEYLDESYSSLVGSSVQEDLEFLRSPRLLVSEKAATRGLSTSFDSISYTNGVFTITNLKVIKDGNASKPLAILPEVRIRAIPEAG